MAGALEVTLASSESGVPSHAFTNVIGQLTRALEEIDRVVDPDVRYRPVWNVTDTHWVNGIGAHLTLTPEMKRSTFRSREELARPTIALWNGLNSLAVQAEIPQSFTASIVDRVVRVRRQVAKAGSGLEGVEVTPLGADATPARFDEILELNATRAVETASLAYGSLQGRLDLISARGRGTRIGLRVKNGPPVMCDVGGIDKAVYMDAFERYVLVGGLLKRNASGQAVRMHVDSLELVPEREPFAAAHLLGALPDLGGGRSAVEYVRERRAD